MTIQMNGPNGLVLKFPDGTDAATIDREMRKATGGVPATANPLGAAAGASGEVGGGTLDDVTKSVISGGVEGAHALGGMFGDVSTLTKDMGAKAADWIAGQFGAKLPPLPPGTLPEILPTTAGLEKATGFKPYEPKTTAGKFARTVSSFVPSTLAFGGVGAIPRYAVAAGAASEGAGEMAKHLGIDEGTARIVGALVGPSIGSVGRRLITPFPATAERSAAVTNLRNEGVTDLTPGQVTGNKPLRYFESELGGMRGARVMDNQTNQFTAAVLRRAGETANRATPEVVDRAFTRIGSDFDRLAANNTLQFDRQLSNDIVNVQDEYANLVGQSQQAPVVNNLVNDVIAEMQKNPAGMPGQVYQAMRSRIDRYARSTKTDPQLSEALYGIRNALDDAMERTLSVTNPNDLGAWQTARSQYRNMLAIEKAATGAGEDAALGAITPARLRAAVIAQGRRAYARGRGNFADLARSGEAVMAPLPQSGTAPRLAARGVTVGIPSMVGAAAAHLLSPGDVTGIGLGAAAGAALPKAFGWSAFSRPGRAYLGNQVLSGMNRSRAPGISAFYLGEGERTRSLPPPR